MSDVLGDDDKTLKGDEAIVQRARDRFLYCKSWYGDAYRNFRQDTMFANADSRNNWQWPDKVFQSRDGDDRPCLTINETRIHNRMIINESLQNKASIRIRPIGGEASFEAAKVMQSLVDRVEYISKAQIHYKRAITHQVEGGVGYCTLETGYVNDKSFDQDIYIRGVKDPTCVFLDPDISEPDGSDAGYGQVFEKMLRKKFSRKYPKFKNKVGQSTLRMDENWITDDHVLLCMYYERTDKKDELVTYTEDGGEPFSGHKSEIEPDLYKLIEAQIRSGELDGNIREVSTEDVKWYLIGGDQIIERGDWIGKYIPIARLVGEETIVDGKLDMKGLTRYLIDQQRMMNYNAPLSLDTVLPTPSGWTTMGDVKPGDELLDDGGKPCKVLGVSEVHYGRKCYRVTFNDGSSIVADEDHLWTVDARGKRTSASQNWSTKTVKTKELEIKDHYVKLALPLALNDAELPVHPYVLGMWLGDGTSAGASITSCVADIDETRKNVSDLGYELGDSRIYNNNTVGVFTINGIRGKLDDLSVLGNKHIPEVYLRGSLEQRLALLQGLMDTDGHYAHAVNQCVFVNGNAAIVSGVWELLRTLGIKAKISEQKEAKKIFPNGKEYVSKLTYRVSFTADPDMQMFRLERKRSKQQTENRKINWRRTKRVCVRSIESVESVPVKCVTVDNKSHLFLAGGGMIPTHNSAQIEFGALQSKTPYTGAMDAFEGQEQWKNANKQNYAFLAFNHLDSDGNPLPPQALPQRQQPPTGAPVYAQGMQDAREQMMTASGQYQSTLGEPSNEKSGKAINERQRQGDTATYDFTDNQYDFYRHLGVMVLDLIPKVYDTKRIHQIMADDGVPTTIRIDPDAEETLAEVKRDDEGIEIIFNPTMGEYAVLSDPGPNYATQRQEAWEAGVQILQQNMELTGVIGDLLFRNGDFAGASEIAERLMKEIKATKPYLFDESADPQIAALKEQNQRLTALNGEIMTKLADEKLKVRGRDERNDIKANDSDTNRMKVTLDFLTKVMLSPAQKAEMEHELISLSHEHVYGMIRDTNAAELAAQNQGTDSAA